MAEKYFVDDKAIKVILKFLLIGTIAFILFITPLLMKTNNQEFCSIENSNEITNSYVNSSIILNTENSYFLETNNEPDEQDAYTQKTSYCFQAINTGSNALNLQIINEEATILATGYFATGTNEECYEISNDETIKGIKCLNCNSTQTLKMKENAVSENEIINYNGELTLNKKLSTNTRNYIDCKKSVKNYFFSYIVFVSLIGFAILITLGLETYGGVIFKW